VATARVADQFKKLQPAYYIKNASDNPINPVNRPEPMEATLLQRFRGDHSLDSLVETGEIQGRNFLVASAPKVSKKGCLRCHGDPQKAPKDQLELYGTGTDGYNYIPDDVVGVSVVGVPLADVNAIATQRSLVVIGLLTGLFAIIFIMVNILVRRYLLTDIFQITRMAQAVSQGDINRSVALDRNDEIGELAHSFELMRRSLVAAMRRLQKK
jgi:HAMP domain-containing protein